MSAPTIDRDEPDLDINVVIEKWAYAGVRLVTKYKEPRLTDYWVSCNPNQENIETLWSQHRKGGQGYIIGGVYSLPVSRFGKDVTRRGAPRYTPGKVDDEQRLDWAAEDAKARLKRQQQVDEANAGRVDALDEVLRPLQTLLHSRQTFAEREALLVTVLRRLMSS